MNTSNNVSAAPQQSDARASDRTTPDGELRQPSVGMKRSIDDISQEDSEIWTKDFWNSIFECLSNDMRRDPVLAKGIHPFLTMIKTEIHKAHTDHHDSPTLTSFKNLAPKHILCFI